MIQLRTASGDGRARVAGAAYASVPAFNELDKDHDGMLNRAEASAVKGLDFAKADTNKDGALDRAEYAAATAG
jgi:hypothetical protein